MNPLTLVDGYKLDHRRQYPADTRFVYSNWTPRGSRIPGQNEVVFFGLQYFLERYLQDEMRHFLDFGTTAIDRYAARVNSYLGPNNIGTSHLEALWRLGYLPLEFRALPEGTRCPLRVPCLTVENTHPDFAWLTNYIETLMSCILWMPCTSATTAYRLRKLFNRWAEHTHGDPAFTQWQGHDFSFRGMPGLEAAVMSAAGHLLSFTGTDTVPVLDWIDEYYPGYGDDLIGGSVPATEHSVMCAGGSDGELETFNRILDLYPTGIVSVVSDTWNLWDVLTKTLPALKERILARDGKLVIRPDSGNPADILCGDPSATGPARKGVIQLLYDLFPGGAGDGWHRNLDPHIGAIYGDSITYDRAQEICQRLEANGFASTNWVAGIGSYTYQYVTRDTYGFAMKATWCDVAGEGRNLFKKPVTDSGEKFSATGRLAVIPDSTGRLSVIECATPEQEAASLLKPVWRNGHFLREQSFSDIRRVLWP